MRARLALGLLVTGLFAGCGGDDSPIRSCVRSMDCSDGQVCVDERCVAAAIDGAVDAGVDATGDGDVDGGPECIDDTTCGEGVCLAGRCCGSAEAVCGIECCSGAEVCFANSCVTPGTACVTSSDCDEGFYCEGALGEERILPGDRFCAAGRDGRCLALPPDCSESDDPSCIRTDCEFRPDVDDLDAVVQWRWDPTTIRTSTDKVDVWSTPVVGRIYDTNCDGRVDALDPSAVIFVSSDLRVDGVGRACFSPEDNCRGGSLRALDGVSGEELWTVDAFDDSIGFSGVTPALGDLNDDGVIDIVVMDGEGRFVAVAGDGTLMGRGETPVPRDYRTQGDALPTVAGFGWGGGVAIADMEGDGDPEVAWRGVVQRWNGTTFVPVFDEPSARGGWEIDLVSTSISFFVDLDADPDLELLSGRTAIDTNGAMLWQRTDIVDGFAAVADFNADGEPEVVLVSVGQAHVLNPTDGSTLAGPFTLPGTGNGGPPTIADFDGDGAPEIGVAQQNLYSMLDVSSEGGTLTLSTAWSAANHDLSSSVTGSTVFDFEGDGVAEVIYNDECFLWVYDGPTGAVRFAASTASFTGTEASLVADIDGDGHAEMLMISTGADVENWSCAEHGADRRLPDDPYPVWQPPSYGSSWRGVTAFRDRSNGWVGTRTLWTQHAYHVTNVCNGQDGACTGGERYGSIPAREQANWSLPWLNNFRQNVQDEGIFDAPDAAVELRAECTARTIELVASVRNRGIALLSAGVEVGFYDAEGARIGGGTTTSSVFPGGAAEVRFDVGLEAVTGTFEARIEGDPATLTFRECDATNNASEAVRPVCLG
ncbi:MAG: VCBS repeat-containing protein [Myxococcota bacterium]